MKECNNSKHKEIVNEKIKNIPDDIKIYEMSDFFKVFGDSTRLKILFSILDSELCVCDICKAVNMSQSAVSHQLRILKQSKLVRSNKSGKEVYYTVKDDHISEIFKVALNHIKEEF